MNIAVDIRGVSHRYDTRQALSDVSFSIERGEIFGVLGPNGGGKTTLFRLLSTLMPLQSGDISLLGFDLRRKVADIRRRIGVVFQSPSLDKKLTVRENIRYQAALYGLSHQEAVAREAELLDVLQIADRAEDYCERLSGGLKRRVEIVKGMIHRPELLLLDEPSTGLDPAARLDLWNALVRLRDAHGVTVVLTTHLLDEAAKADRLALFDAGKLVALDTPAALQAQVGDDTVTLRGDDALRMAEEIRDRFQLPATADGDEVRMEVPGGHQWIARLVEAFPGRIREITLGKPTLEQVFLAKTGRRFTAASKEPS